VRSARPPGATVAGWSSSGAASAGSGGASRLDHAARPDEVRELLLRELVHRDAELVRDLHLREDLARPVPARDDPALSLATAASR
jgi:hypothetical protein